MAIEGLSLRIYLDHNVDPQLARDARKSGYDAVAAVEVGNAGLEDVEQLAWATERRRCIITHDYDDYPQLARDWFHIGQDHAGILLCRQPPDISYGEMLRRLLGMLDFVSGDEMINRVEWLDQRWVSRGV